VSSTPPDTMADAGPRALTDLPYGGFHSSLGFQVAGVGGGRPEPEGGE
jgi:hypothetical protein